MAKRPTNTGGHVLTKTSKTSIAVPALASALPVVPRRMGDAVIIPDAVYSDRPDLRRGDGPWSAEADKIAWRDAATGLDCIILRATAGGTLGGYVGVPPGHPLHGFDHRAIPGDLGMRVHGGLSYSAPCERKRSESRSICHVHVVVDALEGDDLRAASPAGRIARHVPQDDLWWFGFECNHAYDARPGSVEGRHANGIGIASEYRDEAYVYAECVDLAAQLHAIGEGMALPSRVGAPPPPIGLEPLAPPSFPFSSRKG